MGNLPMNVASFLKDPLLGKTSIARVIWLYGVVGSLLYGSIELFLDPSNEVLMRIYILVGLLFSIYVTVATYQCAVNCRTTFMRRVVRISAVISLVLLPVITYFDLIGALTLSSLGLE
jgi:hypothetical protein